MSAWSRVFVVAAAALAVSVSSGSAQSLGEVAKKEQQRRQTTAKSGGKTYTNRDLGPGGTRPAPPPGSAPAAPGTPPGQTAPGAPAAPTGPTGDAKSANDPAQPTPAQAEQKDPRETEEYWRERMDGTRAELQRNELILEALQSRVNALTTNFVNRDDPAQRTTIANDRQTTLAEMERTKALIEKLKQQIAAIEEEARQAGVPPGWVR
jgi:hypothetical protein